MNTWSPEAQKAATASHNRQRTYWPRLARTSTSLVLQRPVSGGARYQADFAAFVRRELPGFAFDSSRGWWTADLTEENYLACVQANVNAGEIMLNTSDGIRAWLQEQQEQKLEKVRKEMGDD